MHELEQFLASEIASLEKQLEKAQKEATLCKRLIRELSNHLVELRAPSNTK